MADGTERKQLEDLIKKNNASLKEFLERFQTMEGQIADHQQTTNLIDTDLSCGFVGERPLDLSAPWSVKDCCQYKLIPEEYTKDAWEAIVYAQGIAVGMHQKFETEHLMRALLEQKERIVTHIFSQVSIDITYVLKNINKFIQCQPKDMGESNGSVLGIGMEALLQRAREWKEEYRDFLVSTEHLLLGFNLDNRIGKYVYKEGKSFDIALNILDAIEVLRKSPQKNEQEEKHDLGEYNANTEICMETSIAFREFEHSWIHLNKQGLDWTNANRVVKDLIIWSGPLVGSGVGPTNINLYLTYEITNNARLLFDEMSSRWGQCFGKARTLEFFTSRKLNMTLDLLKKMKKKNVIAWTTLARLRHIQSGGPNLVKFSYEMLNASTDFSLRRIDCDWWGYDFVVVLVRETLAIRQLEKIFRDVAVLMMNYIDQIRSQDFETDCLNIQGGLGIDSYHIGVILPGPRDLIDIVHELVLLQNLKIITGPRKLVRASTCCVVNHVTRVKTNRAKQFIAIDSSIEGNYVVSLTDFFKRIIKFVWNSKFEVRRTLRNGDLLNYANVICSLSFDRDEDSIVTAEFTRKTKVFVFDPGGSQARKVNSLTLLMKMQQTIFDPSNLVQEGPQGQLYKGWLRIGSTGYKGWLRNGSTGLVKCLKIKTEAYTFHLTTAYGSKGIIQRAILEDKDVKGRCNVVNQGTE